MEPGSSLPHSQVPATCPYPEPTRSSPYPPHPTSWRSILILCCHLPLGLPSCLFPSGFPTKTLYTPLISHMLATCPAYLIPVDLITRTIFGGECRSLSSSLCSFLHFPICPLVLRRSICSPQHPILKRPHPTFLPQCERPCFAPIQHNRLNCSNTHLIFIFLDSKLGDKRFCAEW